MKAHTHTHTHVENSRTRNKAKGHTAPVDAVSLRGEQRTRCRVTQRRSCVLAIERLCPRGKHLGIRAHTQTHSSEMHTHKTWSRQKTICNNMHTHTRVVTSPIHRPVPLRRRHTVNMDIDKDKHLPAQREVIISTDDRRWQGQAARRWLRYLCAVQQTDTDTDTTDTDTNTRTDTSTNNTRGETRKLTCMLYACKV